MPLSLPLSKNDGSPKSKLVLGLTKGSVFSVELYWDSTHDLDAHALLGTDTGTGAKVDAFEKVLSAYNLKSNTPAGLLSFNPGGKSFSTPCGTLTHSGDMRTGVGKDVDEVITIDGGKCPSGVNEIPIFVTIHDSAKNGATFAKVTKAGIRIKDSSGKELCSYELTTEFGAFNSVQMGSLVLSENGWEFTTVGSGFNGDFNTVLEHFS